MEFGAGVHSRSGYFRLPVSGRGVAWRHPTGTEDLLLLEAEGPSTLLALALADRLTQSADGEPFDWRECAPADLDAWLLRLRQAVVGNRVQADVACRAADCGERVDISFNVGDYLAHHAPAGLPAGRSWSVTPAGEAGWFRLKPHGKKGGMHPPDDKTPGVLFRLPTVADQLAVAGRREAVDELLRRCTHSAGTPMPLLRQAERAMEAMAPILSGDLRGTCPACGAEVIVHFDARRYCLQEMRDRAAFIYQDVDLLARRYHWSETEIVTMPHSRRTRYVELARQEAGQWS